jgi:hypothetical protein
MRNRSSALAITSNTKKRISTQLECENIQNERDRLEKFSNLIDIEMRKSNKFIRRTSTGSENIIDISPPNYLDIRKEYSNKYDKVKLNNYYIK